MKLLSITVERKQYNDPVKPPIVQEIIMSNRIGAISMELAKCMNIEPVKALQLFYESQTCADLHKRKQDCTYLETFILWASFCKKFTITMETHWRN